MKLPKNEVFKEKFKAWRNTEVILLKLNIKQPDSLK
jgi:hypothetical protein